FMLAVPTANAPAEGYKVAIFSHDLGRWRYSALGIANALANPLVNYATMAIDHPFHGDRTNMVVPDQAAGSTGNLALTAQDCFSRLRRPNDPEACPAAGPCPPTVVTGAQCPNGATVLADGTCTTTTDGGPGSPIAKIQSGANLLNVINLFATRDN